MAANHAQALCGELKLRIRRYMRLVGCPTFFEQHTKNRCVDVVLLTVGIQCYGNSPVIQAFKYMNLLLMVLLAEGLD
ncbi:hypothetical protein DA83_06690 [Pseudomonas sp. 250J]|nr:hypothetical protein DA83_06690 [Pseudomonas sp. 250J]